MTTTFSHPATPAMNVRRRTDRPTTQELIARGIGRNPRRPYTGAPNNTSPSWFASTITKLRSRRIQSPKTASVPAAGECRSPANCENAEEATQLVDRQVFFLDTGRLEYGTIIGALDSPSGVPEFIVSTGTGTVIKFGDEFQLSQLPEELLAS